MNIFKRIELALRWRAAYSRALGELATYSEHELSSDLRLMASDLPGIAAEAADQKVAAYVSTHPAYRAAWTPMGAGLIHG